jgi:hypothetical protein
MAGTDREGLFQDVSEILQGTLFWGGGNIGTFRAPACSIRGLTLARKALLLLSHFTSSFL